MKKLLSLLLPLALALSLAACGEKSADETARQTPPTLTVTSANACSVTLKSSSYDWTYTQGLQSMTAIACGAHPQVRIPQSREENVNNSLEVITLS